ncbi:hypothetical protein HUU42_04815 [bacterium]|nr:hypothetical protein [bacterium]
MKIKLEELESKSGNKVLGAAANIYGAFDRWAEAKEGDSTLALAMKLVIKFTGVLVMILLSPFLVIGLTIAFLAVL